MSDLLRRLRPTQIIVLSFSTTILIGSVLLCLPFASVGEPLRYVDALFTAASAVCVTGLTVVDTGSHFTLFGQLVILLLIQMGGLGIMTLGTFFVAALGGRLGWRGRDLIDRTLTHDLRTDLWRLLKTVVVVTLSIEAVGAVLLAIRFLPRMPVLTALYHAVFHSVSAFCNAGFSLYADSFQGYAADLTVNLTLMALIVAGGLGFIVLIELRRLAERRLSPDRSAMPRLSFHSRLTLTFTGAIILIAMVLFLALEWTDTLAGMPWPQKVLASLFQAVTPRTAGFNTVPIAETSNATMFLLILVMFIGGASGSCAGGVKVSTFGVLVAMAVSRMRGSIDTELYGRRVSQRSESEALSVMLMGVTVVVLFTFLIVAEEVGTMSFGASRGEFIRLFFETVSAFGTVGLSTGVTTDLSTIGRLLMTLLMLIGRLGPLTMGLAVAARMRRPLYRYPEERVMVG